MKASKFSVCVLSAALAISLVGCGGKKTPVFEPQYYPDCYDPIEKLCKDEDNSKEVKSSVMGAIIGGIGGAVVGGLATGKWQGAAVGAAAGAGAGALTGFFHAKLSKIKDQNERLAAFKQELGSIADSMDLKAASVESAFRCYEEQITLAEEAYKNGQYSKEEFLARMDEIRAGVENVNQYWADESAKFDENMADGDAFIQEEEKKAAELKAKEKALAEQARKEAELKAIAAKKAKEEKSEKFVAMSDSIKNRIALTIENS